MCRSEGSSPKSRRLRFRLDDLEMYVSPHPIVRISSALPKSSYHHPTTSVPSRGKHFVPVARRNSTRETRISQFHHTVKDLVGGGFTHQVGFGGENLTTTPNSYKLFPRHYTSVIFRSQSGKKNRATWRLPAVECSMPNVCCIVYVSR